MAPKSGRGDGKAEWKAVGTADAEAEKRGGKGGRGGAPWANRDSGEGKGNGGKGGKGGGGGGWSGGGGGGNRNNRGGGYQGGEDDYYEGGYGGGGGYGYAAAPWHAEAQDWNPIQEQPAPPPALRMWTEYVSPDGTPYYYNSRTGLTQWERPAALDPPKPPERVEEKADADAGKGARGPRADGDRDDRRNMGEGRGGGKGGGDRRDNRDGGDRDGQRDNRNRRKDGGGKGGGGGGRGGGKGGGGAQNSQTQDSDFGPPGCNLFVFHLPDDWADDDLNEYFAPHGNVISAKVMKELGTGRSRGFGFVSYEDRVSAATAIKKMQGYKILGKRLKVEFKKGEGQEGVNDGTEDQDNEGGGAKKSYPDDERLIGYLRAISAKNVVQSLKESEGADGDEPGMPSGGDAEDEVRMPEDD